MRIFVNFCACACACACGCACAGCVRACARFLWARGTRWDAHPEAKRQCGYVDGGGGDDSLFWIELGDFANVFDRLDVCYLTVTPLSPLELLLI